MDNATLTATPNSGYKFTGWSNGATSNVITIQVTCDTALTAYFVPDAETYNVIVMANYADRGVVSGGGQYGYMENATLTATPNSGYIFTGWSNGATSNVITIQVVSDTVLTAYFETDTALTAIDNVDYADAVALAPNPIHVGEVTYLYLNDMEYSGAIIEILNAAGSCFRRFEASSTTVEIDGINAAGTYLVRITSATGKVYIRKLIIQ